MLVMDVGFDRSCGLSRQFSRVKVCLCIFCWVTRYCVVCLGLLLYFAIVALCQVSIRLAAGAFVSFAFCMRNIGSSSQVSRNAVLLILFTNVVFVRCDSICNRFVVMPCVLSRLYLEWSGSSMCWCMLPGFGLFGSRLVGFAVRRCVLCFFAVGSSLQVFRAGTMVERFTARMHVIDFDDGTGSL